VTGARPAGAAPVRADVLGLDPGRYRPHGLHAPGRAWSETNCAADLWIELVHALGHDPVAGLGFTLAGGFDGDQWRMFTFPAEDLRLLYGIEADELNLWRPARHHVAEQLALGHLVAVDVDAYWLPDTEGLTYRTTCHKTTILAAAVDTAARRLGYFHNTGYHELAGDDFDGLFPAEPPPGALPPYALQVRLGRARPGGPVDPALVRRLARRHFDRRPAGNPVEELARRVSDDVAWFAAAGMDAYHRWAFGTLRQCGANAELAASFAGRLAGDGSAGAAAVAAAGHFEQVAAGMKSAELALARAVRGRAVDVAGLFSPAAEHWARAMDGVAATLDGAAGRAAAGRLATRLAVPA
jgi:hypothetical protein